MKTTMKNFKQYTEEEKNEIIETASKHYYDFMKALGLDPDNNPHEIDTPRRVSKSFVNDLIKSKFNEPPKITAFSNTDRYDGMVFQGDINVKSICSHHHLPFTGKAYVAYLPAPNGKVIGLSKLNRVVDYFCRMPQVQENLTEQISAYLNSTCEFNLGVAVVIEANHQCACLRGIQHDSTMMTSKLTGAFKSDAATRDEFYKFIGYLKNK
jgi:GTP cyclohydrolase I